MCIHSGLKEKFIYIQDFLLIFFSRIGAAYRALIVTTTIWNNSDSERLNGPRSVTDFHSRCGGSMPASQQRAEGLHPIPTEAEQGDRVYPPAKKAEAAPEGRKAKLADIHVVGQAQMATMPRNMATDF